MPNATMKKKVRCVRYIRNMKKKVRSYSSGNLSFFWTMAITYMVFLTLIPLFTVRFTLSKMNLTESSHIQI